MVCLKIKEKKGKLEDTNNRERVHRADRIKFLFLGYYNN
jgi:hypothetical protein